jgi:hypothetical protein
VKTPSLGILRLVLFAVITFPIFQLSKNCFTSTRNEYALTKNTSTPIKTAKENGQS